jgi:hypothetical protein
MSVIDRIEALSASERRHVDRARVAGAPGGILQRNVDMTAAAERVRSLREAGIEADYPHLLVHAAGCALARNPRLHQTVRGYERRMAHRVDIQFSMPGTPAAVVLFGVDQRSLRELVAVMDEALGAERAHRDPCVGLRFLPRSMWRRRPTVGTFQVQFAPTVDLVVPFRLHTGSALGAGRVRDVVLTRDDRIEIRPMMSLALAVDHVAFDGMRGATLLEEIAAVLEDRDEPL